jgi:hypothetical protein
MIKRLSERKDAGTFRNPPGIGAVFQLFVNRSAHRFVDIFNQHVNYLSFSENLVDLVHSTSEKRETCEKCGKDVKQSAKYGNGARTLRSTIDLLGVKLFVEIIFPLQESGNFPDQDLCLVFEFHEILSGERIRWIIISFLPVFHQLGEYVGVFRFEESRLNKMLAK